MLLSLWSLPVLTLWLRTRLHCYYGNNIVCPPHRGQGIRFRQYLPLWGPPCEWYMAWPPSELCRTKYLPLQISIVLYFCWKPTLSDTKCLIQVSFCTRILCIKMSWMWWCLFELQKGLNQVFLNILLTVAMEVWLIGKNGLSVLSQLTFCTQS